MILYLPAALFAVSLLAAYGTVGRQRQAATIGALLAAAWSMALLVDPSLTAWAIGPIVATLLLPRHGARARSSFEGLTRRVITIVGSARTPSCSAPCPGPSALWARPGSSVPSTNPSGCKARR